MTAGTLLALALLLALSNCQIPGLGGFGGGGGGPPKAAAQKQDIPYIQCQVCDKIVQLMRGRVKELRAGASPLVEATIIEDLEQLCDPDTEAGEWITKLDLVEEGDKLTVVDKGQVGPCDGECRTVARACANIMDDADISDFSQLLYRDAHSRAQLMNWLCYDSTDVCRKKVPALPKDRPIGPKHRPLSEDELSTQQVMRSMKAAGMSGSLMDREAMRQELEEAEEAGYLPEGELGKLDDEIKQKNANSDTAKDDL